MQDDDVVQITVAIPGYFAKQIQKFEGEGLDLGAHLVGLMYLHYHGRMHAEDELVMAKDMVRKIIAEQN